jgi:hypothetical protein
MSFLPNGVTFGQLVQLVLMPIKVTDRIPSEKKITGLQPIIPNEKWVDSVNVNYKMDDVQTKALPIACQ